MSYSGNALYKFSESIDEVSHMYSLSELVLCERLSGTSIHQENFVIIE